MGYQIGGWDTRWGDGIPDRLMGYQIWEMEYQIGEMGYQIRAPTPPPHPPTPYPCPILWLYSSAPIWSTLLPQLGCLFDPPAPTLAHTPNTLIWPRLPPGWNVCFDVQPRLVWVQSHLMCALHMKIIFFILCGKKL